MEIFILLASVSVFCLLQAAYWVVSHRRSRRESVLAERLGADINLEGESLLRSGEQEHGWFGDLSVTRRLSQLLEEAGDDADPSPFLMRVLGFGLGGFVVALLGTQSLVGAVFLGAGVGLVPLFLLKSKRAKRMRRVEEQLPEALEVMTISLRAGQSLEQTIRLTADQLQMPIQEEFRRVAEEQALGRALEEALVRFAQRLKQARPVRTFVVSVLVLRQTGGNLIEVLDSIIDTMRSQSQYERKLSAMTAEGRSSSRMLALLPPAFAGLSYLADPGYIGRLTTDPLGRILLGISVTLWLLGVLWVRRMVAPKT